MGTCTIAPQIFIKTYPQTCLKAIFVKFPSCMDRKVPVSRCSTLFPAMNVCLACLSGPHNH